MRTNFQVTRFEFQYVAFLHDRVEWCMSIRAFSWCGRPNLAERVVAHPRRARWALPELVGMRLVVLAVWIWIIVRGFRKQWC